MAAPTMQEDVIALRRVRGFHIGGQALDLQGLLPKTLETVPGEPPRQSDPNGRYQVGQLYAQHFELARAAYSLPVLFWHGGGMTGATWEETPDGRPGWHEHFMRRGFHTCVSDAVERGRASWAPYPEISPTAPEHRTVDQAWSIFRFGPPGGHLNRAAHPGMRFPVARIDQLGKQFVARWTCNGARTLAAYGELLRQFGRSIIVAHSEGARHAAQLAALMPRAIAAVVLIEPAGAPALDAGMAREAAEVPHLVVWGDHFGHSDLWRRYRAGADRWLDRVRTAGGRVDTLDLPASGMFGNSHLLMMDDNSADIADRVADWVGAQMPGR
ncbi:esterase [Achromobacter deleyi]|uniref:esterase n=1 Tax=Achromobacter deleyi TaxID=1353891 RepID=UPI0015832FDC|nr:esterase [Achromobacter deleyi]